MSIAVVQLAGLRNAPVIPAAIWTPPAATYASRVLSYAPAHYWRLATDLASSAGAGLALSNPSNRVLLSRPTLVADSSGGGAASFNGSDTAPAQLTRPGTLDGVSALTFACVLQVDKRKATGKHTIAHVKDTTIEAPLGDALGIELENDAGAGLRLRIYRWGEAASVRATRVFTGASAGVAIGSVIHLAVRFGGSGSCTAFIDGSPVSLTPPATPPTSWPTFGDDVLYLGGYNDGASPFDGLLAEVAIFHTALSDAAILDIHGPTRKVAQVVYLEGFAVGTLTGSGSIDPAAQDTTHPAVGLTAIKDSGPAAITAPGGGVWAYTAPGTAGAFSFTGRISKATVTSAPARTISGAWATVVVATSWPCMDRTTGALDTSFKNQTPACTGMLTPSTGGNRRFDLRGTIKTVHLSASGNWPCTSARGLIRLLGSSGGFDGACFSGGAWICPNMERNWPDWNTIYTGNPRCPILINDVTAINVLFEGQRVHGGFDGNVIGINHSYGANGFTYRNQIYTNMRDDCFENDSKQRGVVVEDGYYSGFIMISCSGNPDALPGTTMTFRRNLFELVPHMIYDVPNRAGGFFKIDDTAPVIHMSDNVFASSQHHYNGDGNFQAIINQSQSHGTWTNNDFCWLGGLPYTKPLPAGVTLLTSATTPTAAERLAQMKASIWDQFPGHRFSFDPPA